MEISAVQRVLDALLPHSAVAAIITGVVIPGLLYMAGFRFQWRQDRRAEGESVGALMAKLSQMQSDELKRLSAETEQLHRQIEQLSAGRYRLQTTVDNLRDQVIAGRVLMHDYERRLGLPETAFPPIPTPTFAGPVSAPS